MSGRAASAPGDVAVDVARWIGAVDGVSAVVLGGSRARGDADKRSGVNLGIYGNPARPPDVRARRELARALTSHETSTSGDDKETSAT